MSLRITRLTQTNEGPEVIVQWPGPQGPSYGDNAASPFTTLYLSCADDNTTHAITCVKVQGNYTLRVNQSDSTP